MKKTNIIISACIALMVIIFAVFLVQSGKNASVSVSDNALPIIELNIQSMTNGAMGTMFEYSLASAGIASELDDELSEVTSEYVGEEHWGYSNLGIANVSDHLNIREMPSTSGKLLGKMTDGDACEILEITDDGWAHVISGEIEGYCSADYLLTGIDAIMRAKDVITPIATITSESVRVREAPNTECAVITLMPKGEELKVLEELDGWVKIDLDDEEAYVSADYCQVEEKLTTAMTMTELLYGQGVSDVRVDLCQYAQQFIGNPYVWGGTSLTHGADCSGFVLSIYARYGITLPHYSGAQAQCGTTVALSDVRPGDLIFYTRGGRIEHVAIYIGNGQVCHASSPRTGIKVSNMYYRTPYKAVSLLP